jgi:hypothetical protein
MDVNPCFSSQDCNIDGYKKIESNYIDLRQRKQVSQEHEIILSATICTLFKYSWADYITSHHITWK